MRDTIDGAKKRNMLFFLGMAVVEIVIGIFSFSPAVVADGVVTITFGKNEISNSVKKWIRILLGVFTRLISLVLAYLCFVNLTKNIGYYETAPQIWCLPFLVIIFVVKLFIFIDMVDIINRHSQDKKYSSYMKSLKFASATTCVAVVGVVGSYWVYHIEPAVGLALAVFAILNVGKIFEPKKLLGKKRLDKKAQGDLPAKVELNAEELVELVNENLEE